MSEPATQNVHSKFGRLVLAKVGGSLFDVSDLRERLFRWAKRQAEPHVLLLPGGGSTADVVRTMDAVHSLGQESAHWLAIRSLSLNAYFLATLLHGVPVVSSLNERTHRLAIVDPHQPLVADEADGFALPHRWEVTSDSLALRIAALAGANRLVLLKSLSWQGDDWAAAASAGVVDEYFPAAARSGNWAFSIHVENLRADVGLR